MHYICICEILIRVARKPSWVRTGQRAFGGLLTSSAAEKEVGCPYGSPSRPLALVARGELGANRKLALLLLRSVRPKGGTPDQTRPLALAPFSECPFCYELQARVRVPACGGTAARSHARLQRKSAVCGLNGFLPRLCLGSLHLNPRPLKDFGALALSPLLPPWQTGNPCFRFGKKNCALGGSFSLQNTNPKESWREGEDQGEHGRIPFVRDDGRLIKKQH
jgi:hypothetical protein